MNSMEDRSRQSSPFDDSPPFGFFYSNLAKREVLAALRFGIEARKGLLLFTGEAGTGKSAILHELARASNSQFVLISISDPRIRLNDLLALILRTLDVEVQNEDEPARIRSCQAALRSGFEANRIVALVLDNAQDLADDIVESLARHFLGKGFAPENNLLQIILAGRPELRERLMRPPLRFLPTQVEIACRLKPLAAKDVARYIRHRLAADRSAKIFDDEAIALIAEYSEGRPGTVNALCRRALELDRSSSGGELISDAVVRAARELEVEKPGGEAVMAGAARKAERHDESRRPYPVIVASAGFSDLAASTTVRQSPSLARANGRRVSAWLILTLVTALAAWLDGVPVLSYGRSLSERLGEIAGLNPQIPEADSSSSNLPSVQDDSQAVALQQPNRNDSVAPQPDAPGEHSAKKSLETSEQPPAKSRAFTPAPPAGSSRDEARQSEPAEKQHKRDLAKAVSRAIENRAILGVNVSASGNMVYLDGRVPTPAQKDAAERAARSVPDVRGVQNRIAVE